MLPCEVPLHRGNLKIVGNDKIALGASHNGVLLVVDEVTQLSSFRVRSIIAQNNFQKKKKPVLVSSTKE